MNYNTRSEFHHANEFILATIRKRFVAFIIDWLVLILIYLCILILFSLFNMNISNINVHGIFDVEVEIEQYTYKFNYLFENFLRTFTGPLFHSLFLFLEGTNHRQIFSQDKSAVFVP